MSSTGEAPSEMAILRRIVEQGQEVFSADAARAILRLGFGAADRRRIDELAAKNRHGGTLSCGGRGTWQPRACRPDARHFAVKGSPFRGNATEKSNPPQLFESAIATRT